MTYPLDTTGTASSNLLIGESHSALESTFKNLNYIIPACAPFYGSSLVVQRVSLTTGTTNLVLNQDYNLAMIYLAATDSVGIAIYGGIVLLGNYQSTDIIKITYQTLGGTWVANVPQVLQNIIDSTFNPQIMSWDQVTNVQQTFPPTNHTNTMDLTYGLDSLLTSINALSTTVANKGATPLNLTLGSGVNGTQQLFDGNTLHATDASKLLYYNNATTAGGITIPDPRTCNNITMYFSNINNGFLTINSALANSIYAQGNTGVTSVILQLGMYVTLTSNGSAWLQVSGNVTIPFTTVAMVNLFSGDGTTTNFTLTNNPGSQNNLAVEVNGVGQRPGIDFTWSPNFTLVFTSAPYTGTNNILVRYTTGLSINNTNAAAVTYIPSNGSSATNVQAQLDYIQSNAYATNIGTTGGSNVQADLNNEVTNRNSAISSAVSTLTNSLALGTGTDLIGDDNGPSLWSTVSTFIQYLKSSLGSSIIGFLQSGTGAVARSVQSKLREYVSVKDFGAVGDGVTDDTAAIQAAINSGYKTILFPSGNYSFSTLTVNTSGITLVGVGAVGSAALHTVLTPQINNAVNAISVATTVAVSGFTIKNLEISGGAALLNALVLGSATYAANSINIDGVYIHGFPNGNGVQLQNCWWINFKGNTNIAYCANNVYIPVNGVVTTCYFTENTKLEAALNNNFRNDCTVYANVDQISFLDCSIELSQFDGVYGTSPGTTYTFDGTYFEANGQNVAAVATINITGTATLYYFARVFIRNCKFHITTHGVDIKFNYVSQARIENCDRLLSVTTTGNTIAKFKNNRGHGATDMLALYKTLLGNIQAEEYDAATGYLATYSSLVAQVEGDQTYNNSHIKTIATTAPTIAALGAAGTGPTVAIQAGSTDISGQINYTPGAGAVIGAQARITFNRTYNTAPQVIVCYGSYAAAAPALYAVATATYFDVGVMVAPVAGLQYIRYLVIGNA